MLNIFASVSGGIDKTTFFSNYIDMLRQEQILRGGGLSKSLPAPSLFVYFIDPSGQLALLPYFKVHCTDCWRLSKDIRRMEGSRKKKKLCRTQPSLR